MWFFNKKTSVDVDLTLEQQFRKLANRVTILEGETLALATAQEAIRNKVLRKIQGKKEEEEPKEEKPKDIYNGMLIRVP